MPLALHSNANEVTDDRAEKAPKMAKATKAVAMASWMTLIPG